ncbi:MAG: hypothetical protein IJK77_08835 [Lachnospiraceae bacterium]|nr:hypothetical protein [Lachnospiraceae bacterium]
MRNKSMRLLILLLTLCFTLSGCGVTVNIHKVYMGFNKDDYTIVAEEDTHGGFLGDGSYYLILDCSANAEKALDIVKEWNPMPLSENLDLIMYGGERDNVIYGYELAEEAHWPKIEHGYYKFKDEQSDDPADDSGLFDRYSYNFEIAVYDTDTDFFYFFKFDT